MSCLGHPDAAKREGLRTSAYRAVLLACGTLAPPGAEGQALMEGAAEALMALARAKKHAVDLAVEAAAFADKQQQLATAQGGGAGGAGGASLVRAVAPVFSCFLLCLAVKRDGVPAVEIVPRSAERACERWWWWWW